MQSQIGAVLSLLLVCYVPAGVVRAASDWPQIEAPPRAHVQTVADDMKYSGVPMRIRKFTSETSVEGVMEFYRQRWSAGEKLKPVLNTVGEWKVIGRQSGEYYQTVQARPQGGGGSEGFIGVTTLPSKSARSSVDTLFPRLPGSQVISDIDSSDDGRVAKMLILKNELSVASNVSYYQSTLSAQDWRQNSNFGSEQRYSSSHVLYFERRKESASIVINPDPRGGTMVVINIVANSL
jgi:hypothetical protein